MKLKELRLKSNKLFVIIAILIVILLAWSISHSFSEDTTSSAWDGVIARSFTSGTGTKDNPYVISNASEFAYFKSLLEGEDALAYVNKNYVITNSFDYGEHEITINNVVPFGGVIDANYNFISNAKISNSLFNSLENATIKNLNLRDMDVSISENTGVFSKSTINSDLSFIILDGNVTLGEDISSSTRATGFVLEDTGSRISNIIINFDVLSELNYASVMDNLDDTEFSNILLNANYNYILDDKDIDTTKIFTFDKNNLNSSLNIFNNDEYRVVVDNDEFLFEKIVYKEVSNNVNKVPSKPVKSSSITLHDSGVSGDTVYINDLTSDYDYYQAMDYTYFTSTGTIPNFTKLNKYNNLVKVYMKYSGSNFDNSLTGYVSVGEQYSNYIYYKYYPIENGYVTIELIDNPFANRPNNKVFMGWITDYEGANVSLDMDTYLRYVKIPVNNSNEPINITMYALWGDGAIYQMQSSQSIYATRNNFKTGMQEIETKELIGKDYGDITDFSVYYRKGHISRWDYYPNNAYNEYGQKYSNYSYCRTSGGCDYYTPAPARYNASYEYYTLNSSTGATPVPYTGIYNYLIPLGTNMAGYFTSQTVNRNDSIDGTYDDDGMLQSGTCNQNSCTVYNLEQFYDENGNLNEFNGTKDYYYLPTRDTNILVLRASVSRESSGGWDSYYYHRNTVPLTITGIHNGNSYINSAVISLENAYFNAQADLRIEYVSLASTATGSTASASSSTSNTNIYGNYYNVKIGRGVQSSSTTDWYGNTTNYLSALGAYAGNTSEVGTLKRYTFIVESGKYNILGATGAGVSGGSNLYLNGVATWGNDLDRVNNNNSNLDVYFSTAGNWGGDLRSNNDNDVAVLQKVKSGIFGSSKLTYACGVYSGGRGTSGTNHYAARSTIVEGGEIFNLIGGPFTASERSNVNDTYIYVKGGTIDMIVGGAGLSTTYGNRIIAVTGGTVKYGVLGGSNGSSSTGQNNQTGEVFGDTFVYIGGNAYIGGGTDTDLYGVTPGGVFGAGNGREGYNQVGSVNNSNVLINGGTITGNVYGGGNFGATGYALQSPNETHTTIKVLDGNINGSVYGGGNNNGSGTSSVPSTININVNGGKIDTSIFGGSRTEGIIYGDTNVLVSGGTITKNVYGGGEGGYADDQHIGTYVRDSIDVTVSAGSVLGSVYGGSAFGTVNAIDENTTSSTASTNVTINGGVITNNVFGGGQGNDTYTPKVVGDITVTINNGDISSVFGGNDQAGLHDKQNEVHLNGGIIENVYGGGNKSSVDTTHVYLSGSTVTNIYGGSNTLGDVEEANVNISSGTVQNVYGGNNEGGSCDETNVIVTGTALINGSVYGGGNQVDTVTTNVSLNSCSGTIPNVYGGGNSASVTTANVTQNGVNAINIYGGSNSLGTVSTANIIYNNGVTTNVYGGNNAGGNTINANIDFNDGTVTTIYGGGNQANGSSSTIDVSGGTIITIFGGGNSAGLDSSSVHVSSGNINEIYGGSNNSGVIPETNILVDNTSGTISNIFGGGNRAQVGDTNVTINNGTVNNIYGGGNLAQVTGDTSVDINGGTITNNIYGGGNFGVVKGSSNVTITNTTVLGSAYAGGNGSTAILEGDTNITIDGTTVIGSPSSIPPATGSVFGGGNQASTGIENNNNSTSNVNIVGGTIYGNVYGGANTSVIYGNTIVNIGANAITSEDLIKSDIYIKGHIFGGGEANESGSEIYDWGFISVTEGVNINVDATNYNNFTIDGSFYGGGNASSASGDSYLLIRNYGAQNNPKRNISIQRVTYVTLDHTSILLKGAIDRANEYNDKLFSISRVKNFKIQNNSELFLETGGNLLEQFESLDSSGSIASVTVDEDNNTLTRTVDNRVYMFEGKNLNIAKDQQVTDYGEVKGMSFLGMFNYDNNGNVNTGMYGINYNPGDTIDWSLTFTKGSYVLGKHTKNHDITVNGFYSYYVNSDTNVNEVKYIRPTPADSQFYMWYIGEDVMEYNVDLVASKYSTLGSLEFSFLDFSKPNTSFQIIGFDASEVTPGVSLVDRNDIPRIATNQSDANNKFGLSMEASNSGWLTTGKTSFYTTVPSYRGVTYYEGENSTVVPTMLFYLYHSKNISEAKDLGVARISIVAITKIDALSNEIVPFVINVNMSSELFQTNEYEGAMTPGDKYELFTSTSTNITTKSKLSAYFGLYANSNVYKPGYHRVLASSYLFPEGTKITMIDFAGGNTEYYYHVITASDVTNAEANISSDNVYAYNLSMFTRMGSVSNSSNYDDASKNNLYYNGTASAEEFIFIVDFSDTNITSNQLENTLLIEMRDSNNETIMSVLGIQHAQLTYNLYSGLDSTIDMTATPNDNPLYIGYNDVFDVSIDYQNSTLSGVSIVDTQYFDSKLGVQIYIKNSEGGLVSGTDLTGAYFLIDGVRYYPDISGYTHIKVSDKVGNTKKWIIFNTENANLPTGDYKFIFEAFASPDGIYYSSGTPDYYEVNMTIINSNYGLDPTIRDESVIYSANNDKNMLFNIRYTSLLNNPNIRIALYRREYDEVYDTGYQLVDFQTFADETLTTTNNQYEYLLLNDPQENNQFTITLRNHLLTGTYRVAFRLYDDNTMIGEINRYIIVK